MLIDKKKTAQVTADNSIDPRRWVELHADYMYKFALVRTNDEELAKDLVQETFLAALEKVEKFEGKSTERTWLIAILKNKIVDVYRKKSSGLSNKTDELNAAQEEYGFFDPVNGHWNEAHAPKIFGIETHDALLNKELASVLQQCMQKLPALWLAVFNMKHVEEEATEFICAHLKVTSANFWVIIHRAKVNLRACLQKKWL